MPRPDNKTVLLEYSQVNFGRLNLMIDSYTAEEQQAYDWAWKLIKKAKK